MFPLIVYDLETTGDYSLQELDRLLDLNEITETEKRRIIQIKSHLLEISVLYVEKFNAKPVFAKIKIKYWKRFDESSEYEKEGLKFYFDHQTGKDLGTSQVRKLLRDHNKTANPVQLGIKKLIIFLKNYIGLNERGELKNFTLLGKNNHNFDDIVLGQFVSSFYPQYMGLFDHSFDLQEFIYEQRKNHLLRWNAAKDFRFSGPNPMNPLKGAYTLENIHLELFGKSLDGAHDSKFVVIATWRIYKYYYSKYEDLIENSLQVSYLDLTSQFVSLKGVESKK